MKSFEAIEDSYNRMIQTIDFSKLFLTALDRKKAVAELMAFELFIEDFVEETKWLSD